MVSARVCSMEARSSGLNPFSPDGGALIGSGILAISLYRFSGACWDSVHKSAEILQSLGRRLRRGLGLAQEVLRFYAMRAAAAVLLLVCSGRAQFKSTVPLVVAPTTV